MTTNDHAKIYRAYRHGWTARDIAAVYGFKKAAVQRVILGDHKKSAAARKARWRANQLRRAGYAADVIAANFGE